VRRINQYVVFVEPLSKHVKQFRIRNGLDVPVWIWQYRIVLVYPGSPVEGDLFDAVPGL